jgi:hypothetical protein
VPYPPFHQIWLPEPLWPERKLQTVMFWIVTPLASNTSMPLRPHGPDGPAGP